MKPDLEELESSTAVSSGHLRCAVTRGRDDAMRDVLVVAFEGTYRHGSGGNPDAEWMRRALEAAEARRTPKAIAVDLSGLRYEWGDQLEWVLPGEEGTLGPRHVPAALVVGDDCREAIRTLVFGVNSRQELEELSWVHEDLPSAWQGLRRRLEAARRWDAAGE